MKDQYKLDIKALADEQGLTLPQSWQNKSEENLKLMLDEMKGDKINTTTSIQVQSDEEEVVKVEKTVSIIDMKRENKSFLKQLQEEEYVDIEIDPSNLYPEGSTVPIGLNGVTFHVPVGIPFEKGVPKSIKETWDYSKRETRKAMTAMKKKMTGEITYN